MSPVDESVSLEPFFLLLLPDLIRIRCSTVGLSQQGRGFWRIALRHFGSIILCSSIGPPAARLAYLTFGAAGRHGPPTGVPPRLLAGNRAPVGPDGGPLSPMGRPHVQDSRRVHASLNENGIQAWVREVPVIR
jgi:hypothetical protein